MPSTIMNPLRIFLLAALILVVVVEDVEAGADDDLEISDLDKPDNSPPPRENVEYDFIVEWLNSGSSDYDATVRLYSDCDQDDLADESDTITMGAGESDTVTLSITFDETGEVCYSATIYYDSSHYGEFENYINVEPETGDADLFVDFDMDSNSVAAGEDVDVVFEYGNDGDVSTQNPVTIMAYFDPIDEDISNDFSNYMFYYISPPPPDAPPEAESMEWEYTIPSDTEDGMYKFTVVIDSDENNTEEDPDLDNNIDVWEVCVGDCNEPDLQVWDNGIDSIRCEPIDPVAGNIVSFQYSIENIGEGDAEPPGPSDEGELVMYLEVMKCPDEDCSGQSWIFVNQSKDIRTDISSGEVFSDDILTVNWSTDSNDGGLWNVRIYVDGENVIEETDETNNHLDWFTVYDEYFELKEQRPDLIVTDIDEGSDRVYQDVDRIIKVGVSQSELGEIPAEDVEVELKFRLPDNSIADWYTIDEPRTVWIEGETTFFEYEWYPTQLGVYEFYAYVDRENDILEWNEDNNEYPNDKYIEVFEKLPDLQVTEIEITPLDDDGYALVGLSSEITATIGNFGVRDMTGEEGSKLEVTFYTTAPFFSELATINVDKALIIGETIDVSIPFTFIENDQYRLVAKVDESKLISEDDEWNNEKYKNIYAVSSLDSYVTNFSIVGDGLAGIDHPMTFDLGMYNVPDEGTYRLHFNVSIYGTFGWGKVLELSSENTTGFYPVGTGYSVSRSYAYIDFNSSYNVQTVVIPWIPDSSRSDIYNISVEVSSDINMEAGNDEVYLELTVEKLTTNVLIESIKIIDDGCTDSTAVNFIPEASAAIKVTIGYPQGEQSDLNVEVGLLVYRATDYNEGNSPIDSLTVKSINGILKGDSRPISFAWGISNGDYIFVAVVDPSNKVKEINETDNSYPSLLTTFGSSGTVDTSDDSTCKYEPVAVAVSDLAGAPGVPLQFSGAATDKDGTIAKYEWDFDGDGVFDWSSTEHSFHSHIFNNEGTYTATFRVTDNEGFIGIDTVKITISEKNAQIDDGNVTIIIIDEGEDDESVPSISLITSLISIGLLAIFRRK